MILCPCCWKGDSLKLTLQQKKIQVEKQAADSLNQKAELGRAEQRKHACTYNRDDNGESVLETP